MEPKTGSIVRKCQPGGQGVVMKASVSYQGCSKNEGWCFGSTPTIFFILERVRASFPAGVGNPNTLPVLETTVVVEKAVRSAAVNWMVIPSVATRCSTWSGVKEISDIVKNGVLACGQFAFKAPQTAQVSVNHVIAR